MNKETFIHGLEIVFRALHDFRISPTDPNFKLLGEMIDAYIIMLSGFNEDSYYLINQFLLENSDFIPEKAYLLYTTITEDEDMVKN